MIKMEMRLERTERMEEFHKQDNIDRGVFKRLTAEEICTYKGPVNYISIGGAIQVSPLPYHPTEDLHEQQHEATVAIRGEPQ
jgi:hypothetical protein